MTNHAGNEPTEARKCSNSACPLRRAHSGPCAPSDWKPGAPSEAQVEAAAKTLHETRNPWFGAYGDWGAAGFGIKQAFRESARAALVAAHGAAPQAESSPTSSYISPSLPGMIRNLWKSDPSENSVRTALKLAGDLIQELIDLKASPVLPSSGVDVETLANLIHSTSVAHFGGLDPRVAPIVARALCEAYKEGKLT